MKEVGEIWVLRIISNGTGILWGQMDLAIVHFRYVWINFCQLNQENCPSKKKVRQQFPFGMSLLVFIPTLTKKLLKMLATAQGLSTVFPLSKILGMKLALTLLMLMIDLIPDQIFFILFFLHKT